MKRLTLVLLLSAAIAAPALMRAQEKAKPTEAEKPAAAEKELTPLRVQVVFAEFEGEKKITSLPYTLLVNADEKGPSAALRMGLRVPVQTKADNWQYMDVGTNIDGRAEKMPDGRFGLRLNVDRSSIYWSGPDQKPAPTMPNEPNRAQPGTQPVVQQFRSQVNLLIRDGQTIQATVATDPVTGHVLKIDVTLNALK